MSCLFCVFHVILKLKSKKKKKDLTTINSTTSRSSTVYAPTITRIIFFSATIQSHRVRMKPAWDTIDMKPRNEFSFRIKRLPKQKFETRESS